MTENKDDANNANEDLSKQTIAEHTGSTIDKIILSIKIKPKINNRILVVFIFLIKDSRKRRIVIGKKVQNIGCKNSVFLKSI
jgi:hypothetical protein